MLNLRTSIVDVHLRLATASAGSSKWKQINTVKLQYLERYGFLVAFTDYLLGSYTHASQDAYGLTFAASDPLRSVSSFPAWLASRPEVIRAITRTNE